MKPISTSLQASVGLLVTILSGACAAGVSSENHHPAAQDPDDPQASVCPAGTPEFVTGAAGLTAQNDAMKVKVRLDHADWRPPAKDYNTWELAITDLADAPLPDAQITWACAWMGAHGHGTNPREIEKLSDGRISLVKQNLAMTGGWQVRLWIDPTGTAEPYEGGINSTDPSACVAPSGEKETLVFNVCVPRNRGED